MSLKKVAAVAVLVLGLVLLGGQRAQAQFGGNPSDDLAAGFDSALAAYDDTGDPNALDAADAAQAAALYADYGMYDVAASSGYDACLAAIDAFLDTGDPNAYDAIFSLYAGFNEAYDLAVSGF